MIETDRLRLRRWQASDLAPFVAINQDPEVLRYLPAPLSKEETMAWALRITAHMDQHGFGLFACEVKSSSEFIGFVGLQIPAFKADFTPCVEIGWRLARQHWGKFYATEAATAVMKAGFENYNLTEILAFTVPDNTRSRRIMEKLGMTHDPSENFAHPKLPKDHLLSNHVLYRAALNKTNSD